MSGCLNRFQCYQHYLMLIHKGYIKKYCFIEAKTKCFGICCPKQQTTPNFRQKLPKK